MITGTVAVLQSLGHQPKFESQNAEEKKEKKDERSWILISWFYLTQDFFLSAFLLMPIIIVFSLSY